MRITINNKKFVAVPVWFWIILFTTNLLGSDDKGDLFSNVLLLVMPWLSQLLYFLLGAYRKIVSRPLDNS